MSWYNNNWNCRKSHVIQHASGAGENYQIKIHVHYGAPVNDSGDYDKDVYLNGFCNPDFGDMRFTKINGSTLLPYWMESKEDAKEAIFWVKMENEDLNSSDKTIYIYYNNLDATTTSSFDDTFIFGDPFDSETLDTENRWSVDGSPNYAINATAHYLEVTDMASNNWWNGKGFHSTSLSFPPSWIIEGAYGDNAMFMGYHDSAVAGEKFGLVFNVHHTTFNANDRGIAHVDVIDDWTANKHWHVDAGVGGNVDWSTGEQSASPPLSTGVRIWKLSGNIHIEVADVERVNEANSENPNVVCIGLLRSSVSGFGTERAYAFKIRKYVSPEPQHGSWGSIETHGTIILGNTALVTGYASKNTTITSEHNPIIKVLSNIDPIDNILHSPLIENIVIQGYNGNETAILIENVCHCQIRNVSIKNCGKGIVLRNDRTGVKHVWTECTHIKHVRISEVEKGIVFEKDDGEEDGEDERSFAFTYMEDVGIYLKGAANCTGIEVGSGCKPYSSFIKANIWLTNATNNIGMDVKDDGEVKYGLVNLYVANISGGGSRGTGIKIDGDNNGIVAENHGQLFLTVFDIDLPVDPYDYDPEQDLIKVVELT